MAAKKKQVGISPKTSAAAVAALVAPLVARLLGDVFGVEVDSETAEGLILAAVAAVSAFAAAYAAPPGQVATVPKPRAREGGYSAVEVLLVVFLAICCLVVLSWLL
jgi:hypothetical protein